jgi:hypothetical protein
LEERAGREEEKVNQFDIAITFSSAAQFTHEEIIFVKMSDLYNIFLVPLNRGWPKHTEEIAHLEPFRHQIRINLLE